MNIGNIQKRIELMQAEIKVYQKKLEIYPNNQYLKKRILQNKNTIDAFKYEIAEAERTKEPDHVSNLFFENSRLHNTIRNRLKQKNINTVKELKAVFPYLFSANSKSKEEINRLLYHA